MALNIDISKLLQPGFSWVAIEKKSFLMKIMLLNGHHADITVKGQGGSVKAHRWVLADVSPVFSAMFKHNMREQLTSTVDLSPMHIEALQLFLVMLYSCDDPADAKREFEAAVDKHFVDFFEACHKYQVSSRLVTVINNALRRNLTPENCWYYYKRNESVQEKLEYVHVYCNSPACVCKQYILDNFEKVILSENVVREMKSNPELVRAFAVLTYNRLKKENEEKKRKRSSEARDWLVRGQGCLEPVFLT